MPAHLQRDLSKQRLYSFFQNYGLNQTELSKWTKCSDPPIWHQLQFKYFVPFPSPNPKAISPGRQDETETDWANTREELVLISQINKPLWCPLSEHPRSREYSCSQPCGKQRPKQQARREALMDYVLLTGVTTIYFMWQLLNQIFYLLPSPWYLHSRSGWKSWTRSSQIPFKTSHLTQLGD